MPKRPRKTITPSATSLANCAKKQMYQTEREALDAVNFRMSEHIGLQLGIYRCNVCLLWHMTEIKD